MSKLRVLHKEVSGCNDCPCYSLESSDNGYQHQCNLGATAFPRFKHCLDNLSDDFFPKDCPLPMK